MQDCQLKCIVLFNFTYETQGERILLRYNMKRADLISSHNNALALHHQLFQARVVWQQKNPKKNEEKNHCTALSISVPSCLKMTIITRLDHNKI